LTIKFTRHMAASPPAFSYQPSALSKSTTHRANSMGLDPAHRTQHRHFFATFASFAVKAFGSNFGDRSGSEEIRAAYTSRFLSGTHKNLQRLVIYPIYSVVKYRPRKAAISRQLSAIS